MIVKLKTEEQLMLEGWAYDLGFKELSRFGCVTINSTMRGYLGKIQEIEVTGIIFHLEGYGFSTEVILVELNPEAHILEVERLIRYEIGL